MLAAGVNINRLFIIRMLEVEGCLRSEACYLRNFALQIVSDTRSNPVTITELKVFMLKQSITNK